MLRFDGEVTQMFARFFEAEEGQGLVEYSLIIALVSIAAIAALGILGNKSSNTLTNAANALS
jgi:pilus assembly protein Flp/PilA